MSKPTGVATSTALHKLRLLVKQLLTFIDRTHLFGRDNTQSGIIKNPVANVQRLGFLRGKHNSRVLFCLLLAAGERC